MKTFDDQHLRAIGQMIVNFSRMESRLLDLCAFFMNAGFPVVLATFEHQQFSNKISTLKSLANLRLRDLPLETLAIDVLNKANRVGLYRNSVVHAYWFIDSHGTPHAVKFSARGRIKRSRIPMSTQRIEGIAHEADIVRMELESLQKTLEPLRDEFGTEAAPAR